MRLTNSGASVIPDMLVQGVRPISMTAVLLPVSMVSEYTGSIVYDSLFFYSSASSSSSSSSSPSLFNNYPS